MFESSLPEFTLQVGDDPSLWPGEDPAHLPWVRGPGVTSLFHVEIVESTRGLDMLRGRRAQTFLAKLSGLGVVAARLATRDSIDGQSEDTIFAEENECLARA